MRLSLRQIGMERMNLHWTGVRRAMLDHERRRKLAAGSARCCAVTVFAPFREKEKPDVVVAHLGVLYRARRAGIGTYPGRDFRAYRSGDTMIKRCFDPASFPHAAGCVPDEGAKAFLHCIYRKIPELF